MDTRRPAVTNVSKPFTRKKFFQKDGEKTFGDRKYQSRDNRFQSRDGKFHSNNNNRDDQQRFRSRDDRYQGRSGGGSSNGRDDDRFSKRPSNGRFQSKNDRFNPKQQRRFVPKGKSFKPWEKDNRPRIVSDMQVTEGKHRGKYLQSTTSPKVRPTARRIREVMFKILYRRIRAGRFLDLCAGCGTVGIEAISRGALIGTFVERSAKMCAFIKKNLEACGIKEGHGEICEMEVVPFLKKMSKRRRFWDVVYFDPPYDSNYDEVLEYLSRGVSIKPQGVLVIEHPSEMFFPEKIGVMKRWRVVVQGDTALSFYERK